MTIPHVNPGAKRSPMETSTEGLLSERMHQRTPIRDEVSSTASSLSYCDLFRESLSSVLAFIKEKLCSCFFSSPEESAIPEYLQCLSAEMRARYFSVEARIENFSGSNR